MDHVPFAKLGSSHSSSDDCVAGDSSSPIHRVNSVSGMICQLNSGKHRALSCMLACEQSAASPQGIFDSPKSMNLKITGTDTSELNDGYLGQHSPQNSDKLGPDMLGSNCGISVAEQAFFKAEGYLVKDKFFSEEEVSIMKAELQRLRPQMANSCVRRGKESQQLHKLSQRSDIFFWLPYRQSVQNAVVSLLGGPVEVYLDCQSFVKPAGSGHGTAWHQDNAYFQESDPSRGLGMWLSLDESTEANGTLHVIPWTSDDGMRCHVRDDDSDHLLTCRQAVETGHAASIGVPCVLQAGGVVFFRFDTPHCTKDNRTDSERSAVAVHFRRLEADRTFRVERPLKLGLGLQRGNVYSMRDLVARCAGDVDKICALIEHMLDCRGQCLAHV